MQCSKTGMIGHQNDVASIGLGKSLATYSCWNFWRLIMNKKSYHTNRLPPTEMTPNEKAISLVLNILVFLGFVVALLYGGPIMDWLDNL